jgi:MSHA biogenesis protein MshQ
MFGSLLVLIHLGTRTSGIIATVALLLTAGGADAQILVDANSTTKTTSSGSTVSWNHTVGSGSNTALVVEVYSGGGERATAVTFNGVSMSSLGHDTASPQSLSTFILVAPSSGTHQIQVTMSNSGVPVVAGATSYTGVNQSTPASNWTSNDGTATSSSLTESSGSGWFVDAVGVVASSASVVNQTLQWSAVASGSKSYTAGSSTTTGAGPTSWSFSGSSDWIAVGFWLNAIPGPDHYRVQPSGSAVNCYPEPIFVLPHDSAHNAVNTTNTITFSTSTGHGDWLFGSGNGTFTAGASNSGSATYKWSSSDGTALFFLRDTYPETVTVGITDGTATATSGTATASEDPAITFAPSGFRITNGSNSPAIIATQVAGVTSTQSLALQAIRTDTTTGACTAWFASGATVNIGLGYQCNNPSSCVSGQTLSITNNGTTTSVAANPNSGLTNYTSVPLKFSTSNAEAPFTLNYSDAGQITLAAKYNIPLQSGAASANNMIGSSQFVVQPYTLKLSNIKLTSSGAANPGASSATGAVFGAAGQAFTATVTAQNYQGGATPNFGQETTPAAVTLSPTLVLPSSGHDPSLSGSFGNFTSGAATGTAFAWPEVGIVTLTPSVVSYLGTGSLTGTASGNVGRFIPNAFSTTVNTPVFGTSCLSGEFGYVGQPFTYTVAPVITATALALGGATTQNYTGALMRLSNISLTGRTYAAGTGNPSLNLSGLPGTTSDPAIADLGSGQPALSGQATLTFGAGNGISFTRGGPIVPFNANISLSINVIDLDGVSASNPVIFGSGSGIAFSGGSSGNLQYYGRLALRNALGSELLDLPMALTTQYYFSTAQGFTTNTSDVCTAAPAISFSSYLLNLKSGETCVRDSGSPGLSGQGCATAAASPYSSPNGTALAGTFNLILAAPGSGNSGALTVTATAPSWLQYPWGSSSNPTGMATFGVFPGSPSRIYQREVY